MHVLYEACTDLKMGNLNVSFEIYCYFQPGRSVRPSPLRILNSFESAWVMNVSCVAHLRTMMMGREMSLVSLRSLEGGLCQ